MQISRGVMSGLTTTPMTQSSTAMAEIKNYILTKGLHPGDALPTESQLCTDLGVSRSSVREAVRTLVALDIVEVRHGHGMFVGQVSMRPMVESLIFKGLLNPGDDHRGLRDIVEVRITLDNHLYLHLTEAFWAIHTLTVPLLDAPKLEDLTSTAKAHRAMLQAAHAGDTPAYRKAITDHYAPLLAVLT